ncbi:MAG TPA: ribosome silencing factor [Candidatus Polarisedimenticolaceae bacterium]|nr:ribosome silencing factor [Candidatus Polarisedimenticolaceae bacterium]
MPLRAVLKPIVDAAVDKKAEDILVLDLRGLCDFTDAFVICHGSSSRQVLAIADAIEERLLREGHRKPKHVEGRRVGDWVLMDFIDVVVHVFLGEKRSFYGLERLWGDAPRIALPGTVETRPRAVRRRPSASR